MKFAKLHMLVPIPTYCLSCQQYFAYHTLGFLYLVGHFFSVSMVVFPQLSSLQYVGVPEGSAFKSLVFYLCSLPRISCGLEAKSLSHVQFFVTPWNVAHQAPLSLGFSRQGCWSGLWCPPPGDLPNPGTEPESLTSPALAGELF